MSLYIGQLYSVHYTSFLNNSLLYFFLNTLNKINIKILKKKKVQLRYIDSSSIDKVGKCFIIHSIRGVDAFSLYSTYFDLLSGTLGIQFVHSVGVSNLLYSIRYVKQYDFKKILTDWYMILHKSIIVVLKLSNIILNTISSYFFWKTNLHFYLKVGLYKRIWNNRHEW